MTPDDDRELVAAAQRGDVASLERLLENYKALVKVKAAFVPPGLERDDLLQEGMIGLVKAVRDYKPGPVPFRAFAEICVERQIITAVRSATRKKHTPLNESVSLDQAGFIETREPAASPQTNPLTALIAAEDYATTKASIKTALTPLENSVITLKLAGASYCDIAARLGLSEKAVGNALQRAKAKVTRARS